MVSRKGSQFPKDVIIHAIGEDGKSTTKILSSDIKLTQRKIIIINL